MNSAVTSDNFFIADTNDSAKWDTLKFPLPKGRWSIYSISGKIAILNSMEITFFNRLLSIVNRFNLNYNTMNYEKAKTYKRLRITIGYDEDIKFFFRISKLHGLEIAFFNWLFSIYKSND